MAKLYPKTISDTFSRGEKLVFNVLKEALDDKWIVVHNFEFKDHRDYEIDFVLSHPVYGIFVIEVKGGLIEYVEKKWYQTIYKDSISQSRQEIEPEKQINDNFHAFNRYIKKRIKKPILVGNKIPKKGLSVKRKSEGIRTKKLLWFPETSNNHQGEYFGTNQSKIFGWAKELRPENLTKWIMHNVPEDSLKTYIHTEQYHDQIKQFFKNYTFSPDSVSINLESEVIERVTSETQRRILDLIDENSILKLRIKGYAGSGKSLIAKEILNKKIEKGESCYLINFSRPVTDNYLLDNNALPDNCKCTTIAALLTDILNVASPSYVHKSFDETERELLNLLNNGQKISINPHCFILDEAQLMKENQYEILSRILENSPLIRQKIILLDPRQAIFDWNKEGGDLFFPDYQVYPINEIYRNTKEIAQFSLNSLHKSGQIFSPVLKGPGGVPPKTFKFDERKYKTDPLKFLEKELLPEVKKIISTENISPHQLGIGCDSGISRDLFDMLDSQGHLITGSGKIKKNHIMLDSWKRLTGLEFEIYIIVINKMLNSKEEYSIFSRAKNRLFIFDCRTGR